MKSTYRPPNVDALKGHHGSKPTYCGHNVERLTNQKNVCIWTKMLNLLQVASLHQSMLQQEILTKTEEQYKATKNLT